MKRGWGWPLGVAGILSTTIGANIWLIRVANNDPSFAVEEDYYQRGVYWDDELAQRARNTELGWRVTPSVSPLQAGRAADLRIELSDSVVAPIAGASVVVRAAHVARARDLVEVTLEPRAPGEYAAQVPIARAGLWELRIDVHRGADRFTATRRLDVRFAEP
jgi:nitrogen fixation protein FixH